MPFFFLNINDDDGMVVMMKGMLAALVRIRNYNLSTN